MLLLVHVIDHLVVVQSYSEILIMIIIRVSELNRILVSYETIDSSSNQGNYKVIFCCGSYIISDETKHKISGVVKMNMSDHYAVFTILSFK